MSDVQVCFALSLGSDLIREEDLPSASELATLDSPDGIFGALVVDVDGTEILDERYWDRLDVVLEELIRALNEASRGHEALATFPEPPFAR